MDWSWGNNPVIFVFTVLGGLGGFTVLWNLIRVWRKPLLVRFERIDVPTNAGLEEALDFWRSPVGNSLRNEFVAHFQISTKFASSTDLRELVREVVNDIESRTSSRMPPKITGRQTIASLALENTGSAVQENVKLYLDGGKYVMMQRPNKGLFLRTMTDNEVEIGDFQQGDKMDVWTWGERAGTENWLKVRSDQGKARLKAVKQMVVYW